MTKVPKVNIIFRFIDFLLSPIMWILGGFTFPLQETHYWHIRKWDWKDTKSLVVKEKDKSAKFGHEAPFGLFHMPLLGGLKRYVVIEATGFDKYWYSGWEGQIHCLKLRQNRIMMMVGKHGFIMYGLGDNGKSLNLKIVGYGNLGDNKYRGVRLF